jgi:hypothetical protein
MVIILILMILQGCNDQEGRAPLWGYNIGLKLIITTTHFMQILLPLALIYFQSKDIMIIIAVSIQIHHLLAILFIVFRR